MAHPPKPKPEDLTPQAEVPGPAIPLPPWGFGTQMVPVRILTWPRTGCMTLRLNFPICKMGTSVHTLMGYHMNSRREKVDSKHSINVSRRCDYCS